jgi:hypothetical protein
VILVSARIGTYGDDTLTDPSPVEVAPAAETYISLLKDHCVGRRYGHLIDGVSILVLQPEQVGSERIQSWQLGRRCPDNQFPQVG